MHLRCIRWLIFHLKPPQPQVGLQLSLAATSFSFSTVYSLLTFIFRSTCIPVSALQVIQQSTGLDLGWQDDPCSPSPWNKIDCEGNLVTSLCVNSIYVFCSSLLLILLVLYFIGDLIVIALYQGSIRHKFEIN